MKRIAFLLLFFCHFSCSGQTWEAIAPVPGAGRDDAIGFSLNGNGYIVTGNQGGFSESNRLWEYHAATNDWAEKSAFPGTPRQYAGSFVLNGEAYIIMGISESGFPLSDCWKYNAFDDQWTQLADFPGEARWSMFSFATPHGGFIGTGSTLTTLLEDVWRYNPGGDNWSYIGVFPGGKRRETVAFCIGEAAITGLGYTVFGGGGFTSSCYRFNALNNTWQTFTDFPVPDGFAYASATAGSSFGYIGTGQNGATTFTAEIYRPDLKTGEWYTVPDLPAAIRGMSAFAIGDTPYFVSGLKSDFSRTGEGWRLVPAPTEETAIRYFPNPSTGDVIVKAPNGSQIQLYTTDARLVLETVVTEQHTAWLTLLEPGCYFLRVESASGEKNEDELLIVY